VHCVIIAAVKLWHAVFAALLFFIPAGAQAAEDGSAAARELARKTVALAGRGEPVAVTWNNVSTLGSPELLQARNAFEAALREAGGPGTEYCPVDDTRAWRASLLRLLDERQDTEVWQSRRGVGLRHASTFTWADTANQLMSVYRRVLDSSDIEQQA